MALVMIAMFGVLLALFGALVGAELTDRHYEGYRRRAAIQRRELNERWRLLQGRNSLEPAMLGPHVLVPIALEGDGSD
jgi:hypothetical protein